MNEKIGGMGDAYLSVLRGTKNVSHGLDPTRTSAACNDELTGPKECWRRLEPPPSLAQRFRHRNLIAGLPADHRADGE